MVVDLGAKGREVGEGSGGVMGIMRFELWRDHTVENENG